MHTCTHTVQAGVLTKAMTIAVRTHQNYRAAAAASRMSSAAPVFVCVCACVCVCVCERVCVFCVCVCVCACVSEYLTSTNTPDILKAWYDSAAYRLVEISTTATLHTSNHLKPHHLKSSQISTTATLHTSTPAASSSFLWRALNRSKSASCTSIWERTADSCKHGKGAWIKHNLLQTPVLAPPPVIGR